MISSGIPRLDTFLGGGIPKGKTLMYLIQPEVEGEIFGMQTLYTNLEKGVKSIFIITKSDPQSVKEQFEEYGWDINRYKDELIFVDAYSGLIGSKSNARYCIEDPNDINSYDSIMEKLIKDSETLITFSSLSSIIDLCGEEAIDHIKKWNDMISSHNCIGVYNFTDWPYPKRLKERLRDMMNAIVRVWGIGERVILGQYYGVLKVDWLDNPKGTLMFKISKPGGIKAFIPKILVTGPFNAGKSTFIRALSTKSVSVDRMGTTVALDKGHIEYGDITADIFGTPGQQRFDPILKYIANEAMGVFLIVDSTKPESFSRAKSMLEKTKVKGLPLIVVANKQDMKNALDIEEIRKKMQLPESIEIVPANALNKEGVFEAFEKLIKKIEGRE
ncbi:MAG: GTP-binding protein [Methanomicrobia archaeon]|nr:GTP-binding protein [Methanomicrobia archaeon]